MIGAIIAVFLATTMLPDDSGEEISYPDFLDRVTEGGIVQGTYNNNSGSIKATAVDGTEYASNGPLPLPDADTALINEHVPEFRYETPQTNFFLSILPLLLPIGLLILFFWWMQRRAQGQMGSIMSIGRSRAKTYTTERPGTTFDDVAGYDGVKQEITEIVDFLKKPERFAEIGARVPKGVLLVGPPGTGKTLIAKAVAGEAGVPFLSVTGSDFMEMFVGVGASRVRDLFQSARKMGKAIIFIDEVDSIGRKRGAGLGGGHDEREQDPQPDAVGDGRIRGVRGHRDDGRHQPARHPRPRPAASGALRPPGGGAAARAVGPARHPRGAREGQAHRRGPRPQPGGPGHAGDERRRPGEPDQRGGAVRGARRL